MSNVQNIKVEKEDQGIRLNRWFSRCFPAVSYTHVQKLCRTGQIRVNGKRVKANVRLETGQGVRIPPFVQDLQPRESQKNPPSFTKEEEKTLKKSVLYKDKDILAINKPAGLAVQGGTKTDKHLDHMLDLLRFEAKERPKIVHRLDKDTSGVLLLARHTRAASRLMHAFKGHEISKTYLALVVGCPKLEEGRVSAPLLKVNGMRGEQVKVDEEKGKKAITHYRVLDHAGDKVSLLELSPETGRTHQLRVHCAYMKTPIMGDGKYGGKKAFILDDSWAKKIQLHAQNISVTDEKGRVISISAPLSEHMKKSFNFFGFDKIKLKK